MTELSLGQRRVLWALYWVLITPVLLVVAAMAAIGLLIVVAFVILH